MKEKTRPLRLQTEIALQQSGFPTIAFSGSVQEEIFAPLFALGLSRMVSSVASRGNRGAMTT